MHERLPAHENVRALTKSAEHQTFTRKALMFRRHIKAGNTAAAAAVASSIGLLFMTAATAETETANSPVIQAELTKIQGLVDNIVASVGMGEEAALQAYVALTDFIGLGPFHGVVADAASKAFGHSVEGEDTYAVALETGAMLVRGLLGS